MRFFLHPDVFSGLFWSQFSVCFFGNVRLFLYLGLLYLSPFQTSGALIQLVDDVFGLGEKVGVGRYHYHRWSMMIPMLASKHSKDCGTTISLFAYLAVDPKSMMVTRNCTIPCVGPEDIG